MENLRSWPKMSPIVRMETGRDRLAVRPTIYTIYTLYILYTILVRSHRYLLEHVSIDDLE